ncbi:Zn-dependent hydrolase [Pseudorhodoplanes sinuspersici]|uniref:Zn-dependent hydrolase n=1 Tax=Pseudorhodoplanes sinuspersici TaxID=1235591 RepID=A0A1W6ZS85_9HYPH|nr:Zn-dependent hydrolase [Pseudorhodoplanes sinuspersici]ARQ00240.1 Zn-dependent hydrolase [Pseudorhodoplanes sinuspersici]RKE67612.1 N-carbamoyl-L-amino-acid hydrolase [Pseudorhodoplanes sinuspersici]
MPKSLIDADRLWNDLMALAAITDPDKPYTRRSFSPLFLKGREWLKARFEETGLTVRLDEAANLIGRLDGAERDAPTIMLGSHSDTVPSGGRFDGPAGVLAALEVVRAMKAAGYTPRHAIEIVDFLAEEPSEYGISCVGSRGMAGVLDDKMLAYTNAAGEKLSDAINRVGGDVAHLDRAWRSDIAGYLELHIEQGVVLQNNKIDLGLVTAIVGITRIEVVFEGAADHAGTTLMEYRKDASLAAAQLMLFVNERANALAARKQGRFVATTGILNIEPNASNVVPGRARLVFDIRAEDHAMIGGFLDALDAQSQAIAERDHVRRTQYNVLSSTKPTICDEHLLDLLKRGAEALGLSTMPLASGAGHDAAFVARIAPSAMLFIPCRDGKSHAPEEWTDKEQVASGAATLFEAVRLLDGQNR